MYQSLLIIACVLCLVLAMCWYQERQSRKHFMNQFCSFRDRHTQAQHAVEQLNSYINHIDGHVQELKAAVAWCAANSDFPNDEVKYADWSTRVLPLLQECYSKPLIRQV